VNPWGHRAKLIYIFSAYLYRACVLSMKIKTVSSGSALAFGRIQYYTIRCGLQFVLDIFQGQVRYLSSCF